MNFEIWDEEYIDSMIDNDGIDALEGGFMLGYNGS